VDYWRRQLAGASALLALPTDRPRPAVQSTHGARRAVTLAPSLARAVRDLGRREGATLFMTLLAGFQALLSRYAGQDDVVVGVPIAGRTHPDLEGVIGCFVNTLALRADLSGGPTFRQLLARIRETTLGAYAHQDVPFEKLVEELRPARSLSHPPLFQVLFQVRTTANDVAGLTGLCVERFEFDPGVAPFDLSFDLCDTLAGLSCKVDYSTALFEPATVDRLLMHFRVLLEAATVDPDRPVAELPLLTDAERHQILVEWNRTDQPAAAEGCVHKLFEAQAARTPDTVAVASERGGLTYREVNTRANRLARHLRRLGVGPDVPVGICAERSPELVIDLLAVLKAGGAYVPLDPEYPRDRLTFLLEDSAAPVLLTRTGLLPRLPASAARVVCADAADAPFATESDANLPPVVTPDNLAYVLYTSGSTGRPKGVQVEHRAVVSHLSWMQQAFPLSRDDRVAMKYPLAFDPSVLEIFGTLLAGARLVVAAPHGHFDPDYLGSLVQTHAITLLDVVPTLLEALLERPAFPLCRSLRRVFCGGDTLAPALAQKVFAALPGVELVNFYGPTEATISATWWVCQPDDPRPVVPIGRPVGNARVYVLDPRMNPVPIGVTGELYIGGTGLARGYLRPSGPPDRFVPDPFGEPGRRLYRSGDLARWTADGVVEFMGRADRQVKVGGVRVESGEVEALLCQHPAVSDCVVVPREARPGHRRLAAYVVPRGGAALPADEFRRHLRASLPHYMIPSEFVLLDRLPVTANGKLDRARLPAPDRGRAAGGPAGAAPRTPVEVELVAIWTELLGVDGVRVDDDFFELGGHSLLAVRLFDRIDKALGKRLPLSVLFEGATVAHLAKALQGPTDSPARTRFVPVRPDGFRPRLYFLPSFTGDILYCRPFARYLRPDQPVYGIEPRDLVDGAPRYTPFQEAVSRCVDDLCAFQPDGPFCLAGHCSAGMMAFEAARQLTARGRRVNLLAVLDTGPRRARVRSAAALGRTALAFLSNLPRWMIDDLPRIHRLTPVRRARRKGRAVLADWRTLFRLAAASDRLGEMDLFDIDHLPDHARRQIALNLQALADYRPEPYPGRVTLFRARTRPLFRPVRDDMGWAKWAEGGVDIWTVPGNHESMLEEPHVGVLAGFLQAALDRAQ
jgi:amino acid adenylation domain-containing protein